MRYKLAIFDFDGTLADSFPFFISVFNQLAKQHEFMPIDAANIPALRNYDARQMMHHVGMPPWKLPLVARSFIKLMKREGDRIPLFEGVDEMLADLARQGIRLVVVSSNSHDNISQILGPENMQRISLTECGASIFGKASRLRRVLGKSGVAATEAIYIGDQATDIEAAHAVKISSGAVAWGYGEIDSLMAYAPAEAFHSMAQISSALLRRCR